MFHRRAFPQLDEADENGLNGWPGAKAGGEWGAGEFGFGLLFPWSV